MLLKFIIFSFSKYPSFLEIFGYVFHFTGLICGPTFFFGDYMDFITGENYLCTNQETNQVVPETSSMFLKICVKAL